MRAIIIEEEALDRIILDLLDDINRDSKGSSPIDELRTVTYRRVHYLVHQALDKIKGEK